MFDTLLESNSKSLRTGAGTIASVVTHAAVIAVAVFGTAQARVAPLHSMDVVRRIYFRSQATTMASAPEVSHSDAMIRTQIPIVVAKMPSLDLHPTVLSDLTSMPVALLAGSTGVPGGGAADASPAAQSSGAFPADQVDKQAALIGGAAGLTYPEQLRRSGISGQVVAVFVVGADGRAEADSVRFIKSDNPLLDQAVTLALRRMQFSPAEIAGHKVRQLVQMPFVFTIVR